MSFLNTISDIFAVLFSRDSKDARTRRELREVRAWLKALKPSIYKSSGNMLQPAFGSALFELTVALRPLRDILSRTLLAGDPRIARRYWDCLVERRLSEGERELYGSCTYDALRTRLSASSKLESEFSASEGQFRTVLKTLEGGEFRLAEAELQELERLADLCRYDLHRLIVLFDPACIEESVNYKPKFKAVEGVAISNLIGDLHSVVADLRFGPSVSADLAVLIDRLGGEGAEDLRKRSAKALLQVNKLLSAAFSSITLTNLLKAVREDAAFKPPQPVLPASQVAAFRERFSRRWREDVDRIQRELKESSLNSEIVALFGEGPTGGLTAVHAYNDELNARLQGDLSCSLAWIMPFRILKTFSRQHLTDSFLEASRRLVVEGFFSNVILRSRLTDSIAKLEKCPARIAAFEESAGGQGRVSAAALRRMLDEAAKGKTVGDAAERVALALDERAREIVEQDVRSMRELAESLFDIISDFKKPTPDLVSNIKTLATSKDKSLIPTLLNGYNAIARLQRIMKVYMVVTPIQGVGVADEL